MKLLKTSFSIILTAGIFSEIFYLIFVLFGKDRNIPLYMFVYFESFILCFATYFILIKKHLGDSGKRENRKSVFLIVFFGILFRITLLPTSYSTSDDVHRYLWEGKVLVNGYNPFTTSPDDSILVHLRDDNWEKVTFKNMTAIYPPFSQILFALNYIAMGNSQIVLKVIYLLFEIITLIFLFKLLQLKALNPIYILLYAWLPLPIMEYFINAHLDVVGIAFLLMFLYFFEKGKIGFSSIMLALVFLTKLIAILILPLVIKKIGIKKSITFYLIFAFTALIIYLPFIYNEVSVLNGLFRYLKHWEFNGSVYNLIKFISSRGDIAHLLCGILLAVSILIISFKYRDFMNGVFAVLLVVVMFSTTVYPWYLGWIAAVNIFNPFYSMLSLFFTINLSNFTPLAAKWKEYPVVWLAEYLPFYGLLLYDLWKRRT